MRKNRTSKRGIIKSSHRYIVLTKQNSMPISLTISSKYQVIKFPSRRTDRNSKGMGKVVFVREGFIVKQMKNFETENAETICPELIIVKRKYSCILFDYRPLDTNKTMFFNEIDINLNKILDKYDNILLAGDLNVDLNFKAYASFRFIKSFV